MANDLNVTTPLDPDDPDNLAKIAAEEDLPDAPPDDVDDTQGDTPLKDTGQDASQIVDQGTDDTAGFDDPLRDKPAHDRGPKYPDGDAEGFDTEPGEDEV